MLLLDPRSLLAFAFLSIYIFAIATIFNSAVLRGLRWVRDPNVRVTPQSPWVIFERFFHKRMRLFLYVWPSPLAVLIIANSWFAHFGGETIYCMLLAAMVSAPPLMGILGLILCPICDKLWFNSAVCTMAGLFFLVVSLVMPGAGAVLMVVSLPISTVSLINYWQKIHLWGDSWFLFDE